MYSFYVCKLYKLIVKWTCFHANLILYVYYLFSIYDVVTVAFYICFLYLFFFFNFRNSLITKMIWTRVRGKLIFYLYFMYDLLVNVCNFVINKKVKKFFSFTIYRWESFWKSFWRFLHNYLGTACGLLSRIFSYAK